MYEITLKGPVTSVQVTADNESIFNYFLKWLNEYNPAKNADLSSYQIANENRLIFCKLKARKLGLLVVD